MADNFGGGENIYFTDDANIVLIDPNSIIDSNGQKKDRVIKQENLVMYANLEVEAVPRTKLSVGQSVESGISNYTIASINFLKPQGKNSFDTTYTDQWTAGRNSQGTINQLSIDTNNNPQQINYVDTQTLGIKSINVDVMSNGIPTVNMQLVDVQGKALFETGGNSPYSVFLYYPYPLFKLTLKGFYGKAIKYELMLRSFNATFESGSGNYLIDLQFIARTSAILDDVRLGYLFALPNMYPINGLPETTNDNTSQQATTSLNQVGTATSQQATINKTSKGYSKLKQVFEEYKSNGLIDKNVPILTLNEMSINLSKYTQFLNEEFEKLNFDRIIALERYQESVNNYASNINEWRQKFTDDKDVVVLNDGSYLYGLKNAIANTNTPNSTTDKNNQNEQAKADSSLTAITINYQTQIKSVPVWGETINKPDDFFKLSLFTVKFTKLDINYVETYFIKTGKKVTNEYFDVDFNDFKKKLIFDLEAKGTLPSPQNPSSLSAETSPYYYNFVKFSSEYENLNLVINQKRLDENEKLNTDFQNRVKTNGNTSNLTFRPTIRNVIGVIMASVDAFYRLMDDVHNNAWNQRNNPKRIQSIIQKGSPSQEGKNSVESTSKNNLSNVVYPWPQFVQKKENSGTAEYQITYPGSKSVVNFTKGYDTTIWPEVDFVEQFLYGATIKDLDYNNDSQNSPTLALNYTPSSAIEFAFKDQIYSNKDAVSFVYEMYERLLLNSFYSGLYYTDTDIDLIYAGTDLEVNNISKSKIPEGELKKIIETVLPQQTLYDYLVTTSNNKTGTVWTEFALQNYTTDYISEKIKNSTEIFSTNTYSKLSRNPIKLDSQNKIIEFLSANTSTTTSIMDTYPFIVKEFQENKMVESNKNFYETTSTYNLDSKNNKSEIPSPDFAEIGTIETYDL